MSTYVYKCKDCGEVTEIVQSIKDDPLTHCDKCGTEGLERQIQAAGGFRIGGIGVHKPTSRNHW